MHRFNAEEKNATRYHTFRTSSATPSDGNNAMYRWATTSHTNIIKSLLKNLDPDTPPTTYHASTGFRHRVGMCRTAYQPRISAERVLGTRHRVVPPDRVSLIIYSTFFLIQEVRLGNESLSMEPSSLLSNVVDLVSDEGQKQ